MALPAGVQTCSVTFGGDLDLAGNPVPVTLTVTPTHDLVWKATGQRLIAATISSTAAGTSTGSVPLPVVDQAGFADGFGHDFTFWAYLLTADYGGGRDVVTKTFQPLTGQATADFDAIPAGTVTPGVTAPTIGVTSFNGATGAVTYSGGGSGGTVTDNGNGTFTTGTVTAYTKTGADTVLASAVDTVATFAGSGTAVTLANWYGMADVTLTANCTITLPAIVAGASFTVWLRQDATGGRTVTWVGGSGAAVRWPGAAAPTLTATANGIDVISFAAVRTGSWYGFVGGLDMR